MATRYYPTLQIPSVRVDGPLENPTWGDLTVFTVPWALNHWTWRLSTSKTDGGTLNTSSVRTNRQGNYDLNFARWMTKPLEVQTVSGTLDLCFQVSQAWEDAIDPPANSSSCRFRLYAYIAVGQSSVVRHVLCDVVDSVDFTFSTLTAQSLASAAALTSGDTQAGDCVVIEFGFRVVSSPTPAPTYPPTNMTRIQFRGRGVSGADLVPGNTATNLTPWFEFSHNFVEQADPAPPANDACADATVIPSAPHTTGFIDTTQSAGTEREVWFTYVAEQTGRLVATALGSNYHVEIDAFTGPCAGLVGVFFPVDSMVQDIHRSQTTYAFDATLGETYTFRVRNRLGNDNATNAGGSLRFAIFYRETPVVDDLYLPSGNVVALREGQLVNLTPGLIGSKPSGVAIDYTETPMDDLNGGIQAAPRLLVGLHDIDIVEILDLATLNAGQFEIDFISTPWFDLVNKHVATLYITALGQLYVGWFGNGYLVVAGTGTLPANLSTFSDVAAYGAIRSILASHGDSQPGNPFADTEIPAAFEITAAWAITLDEASGILYYTSGGFYTPVGGQTIKRWSLSSGQLSDFATLAAPSGAPNPGLKGLQFLPGGGLLVCNAIEVVRLDASGNVVQTFTPSLPAPESRCVVDVKLTADGAAFWVADLNSQLTKFDLATGAELLTTQPYLNATALTQMAIYQPDGITPPVPPIETLCPGGGLFLAPGAADGHACTRE